MEETGGRLRSEQGGKSEMETRTDRQSNGSRDIKRDSEKSKDGEKWPRLQTKHHEGNEVMCGKENEAQ